MNAVLINSYNYTSKQYGEILYRKRQPIDLAYISSYLDRVRVDNEIIDQAGLEMRNDEVMNMLVRGNVHPDIVIVTTSSIDRWECPRINIDDSVVWEFFREIKDDLLQVTADIKIKDIGKLLPE